MVSSFVKDKEGATINGLCSLKAESKKFQEIIYSYLRLFDDTVENDLTFVGMKDVIPVFGGIKLYACFSSFRKKYKRRASILKLVYSLSELEK